MNNIFIIKSEHFKYFINKFVILVFICRVLLIWRIPTLSTSFRFTGFLVLEVDPRSQRTPNFPSLIDNKLMLYNILKNFWFPANRLKHTSPRDALNLNTLLNKTAELWNGRSESLCVVVARKFFAFNVGNFLVL